MAPCFRCGLILSGILLSTLRAYQYHADLVAIFYECETTLVKFESVEKNETDSPGRCSKYRFLVDFTVRIVYDQQPYQPIQ